MSASPPVFVVGCPRSGTTVLQSCPAPHPRVHTLPASRLLRSVEAALPLARWTRDAAISLACSGRPGHLVLRHADLVERPEAVIREADRFLGLDFHPSQLAGLGPERVATAHEPWKQTLGAGVVRPDGDKYKDLLTPSERAEVERGAAALQARVDALPAPGEAP